MMQRTLRKIRQGMAFRRYAQPVTDFMKNIVLKVFRAAGRYQPYKIRAYGPEGPPVAFEGDNPMPAGDYCQVRNVVDPAVISVKTAHDVVYTRYGQAWINGRLMREYSAKNPSYWDLVAPTRPKNTLEAATVIQSYLATTYGDWIGEQLSSLVYFGCPTVPLALPGFLEEREYVRRDCERLGIDAVFLHEPTLIRRCVVIPKMRFGNNFTQRDPKRFFEAFGVSPRQPRSGSIIYLTRRRSVMRGPARHHPYEEIEKVMDEIGARVVDTDEMTFDDWLALGEEAEIVIAEHGAALCNMMYWRPRCVIEFFSGRWWNNSFLFLGDAVGVERHFLFNTDGLDRRAIAARVNNALAAFRSGSRLEYRAQEAPSEPAAALAPQTAQNSAK